MVGSSVHKQTHGLIHVFTLISCCWTVERGHRTRVVRQPVKIVYYRTGFKVEALPHIKFRHWTTQPRLGPRTGARQVGSCWSQPFLSGLETPKLLRRGFPFWFSATPPPEGAQTTFMVEGPWMKSCRPSNTVPGGLRWSGEWTAFSREKKKMNTHIHGLSNYTLSTNPRCLRRRVKGVTQPHTHRQPPPREL